MEYADRIFKAFTRLHGQQAYEGSGIGLAAVKKIVERHNGSVIIESVEGKGAKFTVTLASSLQQLSEVARLYLR